MKYHSYDQFTAAYIGPGEADQSPEEPGVFLLPAWATWEEPPVEDGKTAYMVDGKWQLSSFTPGEMLGIHAGLVFTDEQKSAMIQSIANKHIESMARALGFSSPADAISYIGEDSQRGRDGAALRDWRAKVNSVSDAIVAAALGNGNPMPAPEAIGNAFEDVKIERVFPEPPPPPPPIQAEPFETEQLGPEGQPE